jgi:hypothetical protein
MRQYYALQGDRKVAYYDISCCYLTRAFGCSVMLDDVMASAHENYFPWLSALELIPSLVVDCITWDPLFLPFTPCDFRGRKS